MKKFDFNALKNGITKLTGRTGLQLSKYSPEIFIGLGILGFGTTIVLACRATLKIEDVLDEAKENIDKLHLGSATISKEKYSDNDYKKDLVIAYAQTGFGLARIYAPSFIIGVLSISAIVGSHNILHKRNVALMAAYKGLDELFKDYRKRVVEDLGEVKDKQYRYNTHQEKMTTTETDAEGNEKKVKKTIDVINGKEFSQYARFFDETSSEWSKTPEYNLMSLKCKQAYANDLLRTRGHVFLNEVYDSLGMERTQAGAVVGWVLGSGDDKIDFGMYDETYKPSRDFVNGYERSILLDFNVDGVIYDKI